MLKKLLVLLSILSSNVYASTATAVYLQYSTGAVSNSAYTQVINQMPAAVNHVSVFDSSGQALRLAVGTTSFEIQQIIIPPGGGDFPLNISAGQRVSVQSATANASSGLGIFNFFFN